MSQELTCTSYRPPKKPIDQASSTTSSPLSFVWDLFSTLSNYWTQSPPSFDPNRFQILSFHAESFVAEAHIQKQYLPRYDFAERHIEQLSSSQTLSEALHMLHVLSLMERGIQKWNENHPFEVVKTPKAVHLLYCKLFNKVDPPKQILPKKHSSSFPLLRNPSKTNCFFNVALQTLFSIPELVVAVVFSKAQLPEVKGAFLAYREAIVSGQMDPLDLATTLRMLYPCFNADCQHDASEALLKIIEPVDRDRPPFCTLATKTTYADYEPHVNVLEGFYPDGSRIEETREAVYTLEVQDQNCATLEDALFHSFNEVVTDPTPIAFTPTDYSAPIHLPRVTVQTRYVSAPKFLIFNLSLGDINLQARTPFKKVTLVGLQRTFYLPGQLILDGKGAAYRLLSFNVHKGDSAMQGHYLHYRETPEGFFAISDDVSTKISELEYLLAAQTAYTVVLQKIDQPTTEQALYQGYLQNHARFSAMALIFQTLDALNGATTEHAADQTLTYFISSLIVGEPSYDAFKALPTSLQTLLFNLYSSSRNLDQMVDHLNNQAKHPLSLPKAYNAAIFSGGFELVPVMADLIAKRLLEHPEEATTLKAHYNLILLSLGQISTGRASAHHERAIGRVRIAMSIIQEAGQLALTCGLAALKLRSDKKVVTIHSLRENTTVALQGVSSLARLFFTSIDPLGKNKSLQLGHQLITPALAMVHHHQSQGQWSFAPLAPSVLQLGLSHTRLSNPIKVLTANLAPLAFSRIHPSTEREKLAEGFSALYSTVSQLTAPRLEQLSDPDHIRTSPQGWAARTLQVVITNTAMQTLVTETVVQRLLPSPTRLLSLPTEDRKAIRDKKYQELKHALHTGNRERAQDHVDEITQLEQQLRSAGVNIEEDPLQLQDLLETHQKYIAEQTAETSPTVPIINPEIERHIELTADQLASARKVLLDKEVGVRIAKAKVDEKFAKRRKILEDRRSKPKDIEKAEGSLERARENLRNFTRERDHQKVLKVGFLERKLEGLQKRLYFPMEEQDYLDRAVDERAYWEQTEQQRLDGIVNEKAAAAIKSKKRMERKFKEYDKTTFFGEKEFKAYWKAREKYKARAEELNLARINSGLPPEPAFERKAPPKKGPIEKALDKTERFLKRIGFSGEASTRPLPLYTTEPPKSTPSYIPDYGPSIPTEPVARPITAPTPTAQPYAAPATIQPHVVPTFQNPFIPVAPNALPPASMPTLPRPSTALVPSSPARITTSQGISFQTALNQFTRTGTVPHSTPIELDARTHILFLPQSHTLSRSPLPQASAFQPHSPEVYALARQVDDFGQQRLALLSVNMEQHSSKLHPSVSLTFKTLAVQTTIATNRQTPTTPDLQPPFLTMRDGSLLPHMTLMREVDLSSSNETRGLKELFNTTFGIVGVAVDLFTKVKNPLKQLRREIEADPLQAANNTLYSLPLEGGRVVKEIVKFSNNCSPVGHLCPQTNHQIDQLSQWLKSKYLITLKTAGAPIDPNAATSKLGRELFYWVIPLGETTKAVQCGGKALIRKVATTLEKRGVQLSEETIRRALTKITQKELALIEGRATKKLTTQELTHQVEKRAVPKTTSSVNKAQGAKDGTPRPNIVQNKQASDALKQIEKKLGRKLTKDDRKIFHRHISGQNYNYQELIDEGYWLFYEP